MIPAVIFAAAQILANKQQQDQARRDAYQAQLNKSASRMGGGDYLMSDAYDNERHIGQMSADYGPILSLIGKYALSDSEDGVKPRSGVKLRMEDF